MNNNSNKQPNNKNNRVTFIDILLVTSQIKNVPQYALNKTKTKDACNKKRCIKFSC